MKKRQQKTQLALISIGFLLILLTYLYYPYINKDKPQDEQFVQKVSEETLNDAQSNFENVTYEGLTGTMQRFSVKSESAHILDTDPDLVFMKNMLVEIHLNDGRTVRIRSKAGRYHKESHDCWFVDDVVADDGEIEVKAGNLDLLASENLVNIYNNVIVNYPTGSLNADSAVYDFETKYMKLSMFDDKTIKMKVFQ